MRAKEYIHLHQQELKHATIVSRVIEVLLPLRADRVATNEYMYKFLFADKRNLHYLQQKSLFERGNAMQQTEPTFEEIEGEVSMDIAAEVREELFHVIKEDNSFGYLFYILGTEKNTHQNNEPIDCIPNEERIIQSIIANRDDYPKSNLDNYINESLNYKQYCTLTDGKYWEDDDEIYLKYFNRVYEMYDELRIRKRSVSEIKNYLRCQEFQSDAEKYWTLSFIITLIEKSEEKDDSLDRCRQEVVRIVEPMRTLFPSCNISERPSPVYLAERRGAKIDIIRVFNTLYELGFFAGRDGSPITKKEFMINMGNTIHVDLINYDKDLSRSLSDSTALDKHLKVFKDMLQKMTDIFNLH